MSSFDMKNLQRLPGVDYLAFPFHVTAAGPALADRAAHVRQQIEQVLFTVPGERVFRPEFGAGAKRLVFEPNDVALSAMLTRRLQTALQPALQGEVDPKTLTIAAYPDPDAPERLLIEIGFTLAAIGYRESYRSSISAGAGNG